MLDSLSQSKKRSHQGLGRQFAGHSVMAEQRKDFLDIFTISAASSFFASGTGRGL